MAKKRHEDTTPPTRNVNVTLGNVIAAGRAAEMSSVAANRLTRVALRRWPAHEEAAATAKRWIEQEVGRMKRADEIPSTITEFARELASRMKEAVRAGDLDKAVGWRYIKNMLPKWGLWPVSSIK